MALTDKNIVITPNIGQTADPKIVFSGADATTSSQNITLQVYPTNNGTLSFEGSNGQLFSITNNFTGTIFSVNDISGIPSIEVLDTGEIKLAQYNGFVRIPNKTNAFSTESGALQVVGGIGVQGDIWARNIYTNGQPVGGASSTSTNLSGGTAGSIPYQVAPGETSFIGIGPSNSVLTSNGTTATWVSANSLRSGFASTATHLAGGQAGWIPIQKANSQTGFISSGTSGQLLMMDVNNAVWANTSSITVQGSIFSVTATNIAAGAAGQIPYQISVGVTDFTAQGSAGTVLVSGGTGSPVWQNTLTLAGTTQATSTNSGALQVAGGAGIGGNLWVGGTLYASVQGSINTATNIAGGATGAIVYQAASGITNFISIGGNGSLLQSNGSTATWASTTTLRVGYADVAAGATSLAGGALGSIPYQGGPGVTRFIGIGSNGSLLISNGTTATWTGTLGLNVGSALLATTATHLSGGTTGSIPVQTAAGRTSMLAIGTVGSFLQSNGTTAQWISTGSALVGSTQNINGGTAGQIPFQESPGITQFISPAGAGSILQTGASGTATFVSSSSITVGAAINAYTATFAGDLAGKGVGGGALVYQFGEGDTRFLGTGTAGMVLVSRPGTPAFENSLRLDSTLQATNTTTGALQVAGGAGIGGNLYVGGILYASVEGSINTATNLAGGTAGALVYQSSPGATAFLTPAIAGALLQSNGTTSAPSYASTQSLYVGWATNAVVSTNIRNGATGSIPIQSAAGTTSFVPIGAAGTLLQSNGSTATWITTGSLIAGTAATSINISGGAANQIPYQSAPGTTTFSANLTFNGTALTVSGAVTAASFIPSSSTIPTNGMYLPGANQLGFATNSGNKLLITSAGYVGINQTTPWGPLEVRQPTALGGAAGNNVAITRTTNAGGSTGNNVYRNEWRVRKAAGTDWTTHLVHDGISVDASFATPGSDTRTFWERDPNSDIQYWGTGANKYLTLYGNVLGVQATTPGASKLQTGGNFTNLGGRLLTSNGSGWLADGTTPHVVISDSITNTSKGASIGLVLHNDSPTLSTYSPMIAFSRRSNSTSYNSTFAAILGQATGQGPDTNWVSGDIVFSTAPATTGYMTEQMRLNSAGDLGININPTVRLHISDGTPTSVGAMPAGTVLAVENTTGALITIRNSADNGVYSGLIMQDNNIGGQVLFGNAGGGGDKLYLTGNSGVDIRVGTADSTDPTARTQRGLFDGNGLTVTGNGYFTGDVYTSYSDINLKTVLGQIEDPLLKVRAIETFYYEANEKALKMGAPTGKKVGLSAQSVQSVMPEAVSQSPLNKEYLTVQYERLVPLLIEAIKKLEDTVKEQQEQINQLKSK